MYICSTTTVLQQTMLTNQIFKIMKLKQISTVPTKVVIQNTMNRQLQRLTEMYVKQLKKYPGEEKSINEAYEMGKLRIKYQYS